MLTTLQITNRVGLISTEPDDSVRFGQTTIGCITGLQRIDTVQTSLGKVKSNIHVLIILGVVTAIEITVQEFIMVAANHHHITLDMRMDIIDVVATHLKLI